MSIEELFHLCIWVEDNVIKTQLPQKYAALYSILSQNTLQNRQKQPFENQKEELFNVLNSINLFSLSDNQMQMLTKIGVYNYIGENGIKAINDNLYDNQYDIATLARNVNAFQTELNQGIAKVNALKQSLAPIVEEVSFEDIATLRIRFAGEVGINNVVDLKKQSTIWHEIGRGISMYHNESPESFKVVGAENGSIIFTLSLSVILIKTVSDILMKVLSVHEKVLDIRLKKEELKNLKLQNQQIQKELDKEIKHQIDSLEDGLFEYLKEQRSEAIDGELETILKKSIKRLVEFVDKGGELDVTLLEDANEEDVEEETGIDDATRNLIADVKRNNEEIRRIETKIQLLEHKS